MVFIRLFWRVVRRRWVRRFLLWIVLRLLRAFGWRRAVRLLFRGRNPWRVLALGAWRAAVRVLRLGRATLLMIAWARERRSQPLGPGTRAARLSAGTPARRRLQAAYAQRSSQLPQDLRTQWRPRLARRRDHLRRSVFAAIGMDPDWRPPSRRGTGVRRLASVSPVDLGSAHAGAGSPNQEDH